MPPEYRRPGLGGLYPIESRGTLGRGVCIGGARETRAAFNASLARLGVARMGLYLLHWPLTTAAYPLDDPQHRLVRMAAWRELLRIKQEGLAAAVGVSNFSPRQLREVIAVHPPDVLQIEMHLLLQQPELRELCAAHGILIQSYGHRKLERAQHNLVTAAAEALRAPSVGLLSMRWALHAGAAIIPRSRTLEYVAANQRVFDFALPAGVIPALEFLNQNASLYGLHEVFVRDAIR